ncbi:hypothetical protein D3C81_1664040 [compost metagenome]
MVRQPGTEQPHRHQRQANGQAGGKGRPAKRGDGALQLAITLQTDDFVQHQRAGRLAFLDGLALFGRKLGGGVRIPLAVVFELSGSTRYGTRQ